MKKFMAKCNHYFIITEITEVNLQYRYSMYISIIIKTPYKRLNVKLLNKKNIDNDTIAG